MKTPEEMAEEWIEKNGWNIEPFRDEYTIEFQKQGYIAGYKAAVPQWVSVNERLPDFEVLCIWVDVRRIAVNGLAARGVDDCEPWEEGYTHWMPLPEPPKEEE